MKNAVTICSQDLLARFTTDIIASCAFGININSVANPNDQFRAMGRKMFEADFIQGVKNACFIFLPFVSECFEAFQFASLVLKNLHLFCRSLEFLNLNFLKKRLVSFSAI
jgi:hypothetical protein